MPTTILTASLPPQAVPRNLLELLRRRARGAGLPMCKTIGSYFTTTNMYQYRSLYRAEWVGAKNGTSSQFNTRWNRLTAEEKKVRLMLCLTPLLSQFSFDFRTSWTHLYVPLVIPSTPFYSCPLQKLALATKK